MTTVKTFKSSENTYVVVMHNCEVVNITVCEENAKKPPLVVTKCESVVEDEDDFMSYMYKTLNKYYELIEKINY